MENTFKNICEFCGASFKQTQHLNRHIKTNQKCLSSRGIKESIKCIWCNDIFSSKTTFEKHKNICSVNKEIAYATLLEKYNSLNETHNKYIEEKDKQIKDLQDKLFAIANKTTTTNNTYNTVTLICGKPLSLDKDRVYEIMYRTCIPDYLLKGGEGLAIWFVDNVCKNSEGRTCIQCTDKKRKIFKYINDDDKLEIKSEDEIYNLMSYCRSKFAQESEYYNEFKILCDKLEYPDLFNIRNSFVEFREPFMNKLIELTYKDNLVREGNS
jgi:hypothetical protein